MGRSRGGRVLVGVVAWCGMVEAFVGPSPSLSVRRSKAVVQPPTGFSPGSGQLFNVPGSSTKLKGRASAVSAAALQTPLSEGRWRQPKQWVEFVKWLLVPPPPPLPYPRIEGAEMFRTLGVAPNADYDEVQSAVKALKEKYAGDKKKLMQIDVAKDKIAELRLRQRMRGELAVTSEVAYLDRQAAVAAKNKFRDSWTKNQPRWVRRIPLMYIPPNQVKNLPNAMDRKWSAAHIKMAGNYMIGAALICILFPGSMGIMRYLGPFLFLSHLAQRGREPVARGPDGMAGEVQQTVGQDYVWAFLILSVYYVIGYVIANLLVPVVTLLRPAQIRFLVTTAALAVADVYWQPHLIQREPVKKR